MEPETEVLRRVYCDEGTNVEIGDWPDGPDFLELRTVGDKNIEWFGEMHLSMTPAFALELGNALVKSAMEKLEKK